MARPRKRIKDAAEVTMRLDEVNLVAEQRGGRCLSRHYVNALTKLEWQCAHGHRWQATPNHVKRGSWCGKCRGTPVETIAALAVARGGRYISTIAESGSEKRVLVECSKRHRWETRPSTLVAGQWCRICAQAKRRFSLNDMQSIATKRGGLCLSTIYTNSKTRLSWQCSKGHRWEALPWSVKACTWCRICANNNRAAAVVAAHT